MIDMPRKIGTITRKIGRKERDRERDEEADRNSIEKPRTIRTEERNGRATCVFLAFHVREVSPLA